MYFHYFLHTFNQNVWDPDLTFEEFCLARLMIVAFVIELVMWETAYSIADIDSDQAVAYRFVLKIEAKNYKQVWYLTTE